MRKLLIFAGLLMLVCERKRTDCQAAGHKGAARGCHSDQHG